MRTNINDNNEVKFKFREREGEVCKIDINEKKYFTLHIKSFFLKTTKQDALY